VFSECFWGDKIANEQQLSLEQCDMPCDGNPRQICGGGNRILVYENSDWKISTRKELAAALENYMELTGQLSDAVDLWKDLALEYDAVSLSFLCHLC